MLPIEKLEALERRFEEVNQLLCDPTVLAEPTKLRALNKERSDLEPVVGAFGRYKSLEASLSEAREALADPELKELAQAELDEGVGGLAALTEELQLLLLPRDPNDERNTILEIRAGTGGEEAALFAADLFRMFSRFAETRGWTVEVLNSSEASAGGYKEIIALVSGKDVYSHLRFEAGVHRVQRVPATETQGRVHTSTATVAVLPEADEVDVAIDEADLDISIAASGGPGGQGVNTTNSAVQIRHVPSGLIVKCQDERSQHKNKARALKVLRSRLLEIEQQKQADEVTAERRGMVGSGERSEKIRTYNYAQNRVTDHRINLTLYKLDQVMQGDLEELVTALRAHRQAELLREQDDG
ncbi:MAG: peptide chain release factor 1 [Polyangiaceae bacterium]